MIKSLHFTILIQTIIAVDIQRLPNGIYYLLHFAQLRTKSYLDEEPDCSHETSKTRSHQQLLPRVHSKMMPRYHNHSCPKPYHENCKNFWNWTASHKSNHAYHQIDGKECSKCGMLAGHSRTTFVAPMWPWLIHNFLPYDTQNIRENDTSERPKPPDPTSCGKSGEEPRCNQIRTQRDKCQGFACKIALFINNVK